MIPALLKDASKVPEVILDQKTELSNLEGASEEIGNEFKCEVVVEGADESEEEKAKVAMPGKPAIIIQK